MAFVAGGVSLELLSPPGALGLWDAGIFAVPVQMPEAPMHKNADAVAREDDVRRARQITLMETKTIAHGVEHAPDDKFRLGILAANAGHQAAALLSGKGVGHQVEKSLGKPPQATTRLFLQEACPAKTQIEPTLPEAEWADCQGPALRPQPLGEDLWTYGNKSIGRDRF